MADTPENNGAAPAKTVDTSGAPQQIVSDVDLKHPAVDNDPRANTDAIQNRIDFNDPTKPGHVVVAEQLGMTVVDDAEADAEAAAKKKS